METKMSGIPILKNRMRYSCLLIWVLACLGWLVLIKPHHALADTNVTIGKQLPLPNSADIYQDTTLVGAGTPSVVVGLGAFDGNYSWAKVYVPIGQTATITIQNGGGYCVNVNDSSDAMINTSSYPNVNYTLQDLDANEMAIGGTGTYYQALNSLSGGTSCKDLTFPTILASDGVASVLPGHAGYRVFYLVGHIINCPDSNTTCAAAGSSLEKNYRLKSDNALIGYARTLLSGLNPNKPFGVMYRNLDFRPGDNFTYNFQFAPRCDEAVNPDDQIITYDIDNGGFNPQYLSGDLYQNDKSQASINWVLQEHYTADDLGAKYVNHSTALLKYSSDPRFAYKFYVRQVNKANAIQFYTGLDQFDASEFINCFDSSCSISLNPAAGVQMPDKPIQITVKMHNAGVAPWPGTFKLGQVDPSSPNTYTFTSPPSTVPVEPGEDGTFIFNVTRGSPGTYSLSYQMQTDAGSWFGAKCDTTLNFSGDALAASCTEASPKDFEPGQTQDVTIKINFSNNTGSSYGLGGINSGSGYNFNLSNSAGLKVSSLSQSPSQIATGDSTVTISLILRADYTGTLTVDLYKDGTPANLKGSPPLPCATTIVPASRSFFQVKNGDISAGGGFRSPADQGGSCGGSSDPLYVAPAGNADPEDRYLGGIQAFGNRKDDRGSNADFGVLALGLVVGNGTAVPDGPEGFYTNNPSSSSYKSVFANDFGGVKQPQPQGGLLNGSPPDHCVPDFFTDTRQGGILPLNAPGGSTDLGTIPDGEQREYKGDLTLTAAAVTDIPKGKQITLFVEGNVTITGDITYDKSWDSSNEDEIPYFALIVKGNIIVSDNVTRLDGLYVAQPEDDNTRGVFATCQSDTLCTQQLTVNGAVIAQELDLLRAYGSLGPCNSASPTCALSKPAEVFNFTPTMILGAPEFDADYGQVESIFSLPPVF